MRYQQLQPEDRMTLASLAQQKYSVRAMAQVLGRSPSTISRELRRNAQPAGYASTTARACAHRRRLQGRPLGKLHRDGMLFGLVRHFLGERWSPEQIALTLACIFPRGHERCVSHETIYNCIYAQPVGELKRELIATLRHAHNKRVPRSKGQDRRGQIPNKVSIQLRPPEIEDRQFPGHWEGDLIKGAANVMHAFSDKLLGIAAPMRQSMSYDQGREMAMHKELSPRSEMAVYFCDPHSPWQRGSNENTNGLVRQHLPKGTDLSGFSQEQLDAIANQINNRSRKGLGVRSPLAIYRELLLNSPQHSSLVH
ncbi:IS30 family transposase [Hydrogenophaga taeniospiralis]|uniref:IS30 family transposase n=1 Tax=Hydrogenophaga taeniospiralis TaxID=65656 RepID=UPI001CFBAA78|nr:IS30 family transposase [Hydrogenophaga taeniospiralis]UCU95904.1 IS30 family transposase [Hydrogenophaga taeniospiralis]